MVGSGTARGSRAEIVTPIIDDGEWTEHEGDLYRFHVVLTPSEDGGYTVTVPRLPGAISEGETESEALDNIREALKGLLAAYKASGEPIPWRQPEVATPPDGVARTVFVNV
jgi:predicted RNase H-like HicB family nuclease